MRMPLAGFQKVIGSGIASIRNGMLRDTNMHADLVDALRSYGGNVKRRDSSKYTKILENSRNSSLSTETSFYQMVFILILLYFF